MFSLVSARYERASLIVTSNKPFSAWGEIFGDEMTAVAMIDRLVHHAEVETPTIRRWLSEGLLPAEQSTPHAPWRIRLTDEVRRRFVPDLPPRRSASPARSCCTRSNAASSRRSR
jgi:IstB-like ATP binding protein